MLTTAFPRWPNDDRGIFILNMAQAICHQGIQVRILGIHSPGATTHEVIGDIEVIRTRYLPERLEILQSEGGGLPEVWRKYPLARLAIFPFIFSQIIATTKYAKDCDIIHANWTLSGIISWLSKPLHRLPYLVMVHGSDIYQAGKNKLAVAIMKPSILNADGVIAISHSLANEVVNLRLTADNPTIIPETIDTRKFYPLSPQERGSYILFVGSLIQRKGGHILLKAFRKIHPLFPQYKLIIIGEGSEEQSLKNLARVLGLSDNVSFLGKQPPNIVAEWMRRSKIFVLPSIEEGLGVVLLEACASGTPCVASDTGGIPDVIDSEIGILVEPSNPDALADGILSILNNPPKWERMSLRARDKVVEQYSLDTIGKKLYHLYHEILSKQNK